MTHTHPILLYDLLTIRLGWLLFGELPFDLEEDSLQPALTGVIVERRKEQTTRLLEAY
ncbi:hypothetical protein I3842_04G003600 [Carya illinoinensis]|uniref:Uncharacterized protein n=1 Tax=Carya illinoinensis TaxID=32201 RepID=A0A922F948_CARIL|nr:hypothetical protein I3842_Q135700 [Carya illinoinensis]KAG6715622.1 hypothetical protein I3842_04G003600 [Carya illinoinensis]